MEQKVKIIIIALAAVLGLSLLFNIQSISAKLNITRERDKLKEENTSLSKRIEDTLKENRTLQDKFNLLNQNLDRLTREKDAIQKKLDLVEKARTDLVEQLKAIKEKAPEEQAGVSPSGTPGQDLYWAGVLKQKKDLEWQLETMRTDLKNVQLNNEQLQKDKNSLELEMKNLDRDKQELLRKFDFAQKQLEYNKKIMDTVNLELVGEKNDKLQIEETLKLLKNENYMLRRQLKGLHERKISLERKLADLDGKNKTLESRFDEMDILLKDKTLQLDKLNKKIVGGQYDQEEAVELSPIVVRPQSTAKGAVSGGSILAVNRENNFVVIDLGEEGGAARVGDVFHVFNKEGKMVGTIEVIETRKSISACDIRKELKTIQIGDIVKP